MREICKIFASGAFGNYVLPTVVDPSPGLLRIGTCSPWAGDLLRTVHGTGYPCMDGPVTLFLYGGITYI
jgi:hypothetical protein